MEGVKSAWDSLSSTIGELSDSLMVKYADIMKPRSKL